MPRDCWWSATRACLEQGAADAGVKLSIRAYDEPEKVDWSRDEIAIMDLGNIDPR
jgi:hypothetical protein